MIKIRIEKDPELEQPEDEICCNVLRTVLEDQGIDEGTITAIFGQDELLLSFKKQFFKKNQFTDVIAFRLNNYEEKTVEGEVYISLPRAKENAKIFGEPFEKEVVRLLIHGVLHLLGYDDSSKKSKKEMTLLEDTYLKMVDWKKLFSKKVSSF
jgi:rRNA maturation RNase YbeY